MINLGNNDFNSEISNGMVLVDFYADWCGPCKMMHTVLKDLDNDIKIVVVDIDKREDLANKYNIMSIPTLMFFKDGNLIKKNIGFTPKNIIEEWINYEK